jgi:hypothetical protein
MLFYWDVFKKNLLLRQKNSLFVDRTHTQLLIGLILYFVSPLGFASLGQMSDKTLRLLALEHP